MPSWTTFPNETGEPYRSAIAAEYLDPIRTYLTEAITELHIPGAVVLIAHDGRIVLHAAFGNRQLIPATEAMTVDTVFDLASLTKVIATLPAILHLVQQGALALDAPLSRCLPIPAGHPLAAATISQLLTHTAGLPERTGLLQYGTTRQEMIRGILAAPLDSPPGARVAYANRGFILLGELVERVSDIPLDRYVRKFIWNPLGMSETWFNPPPDVWSRTAPTEYRNELAACQRGTVHDENATLLGGIAGHAGVFSTASDLATFCAMILADGYPVLDNGLIASSLCLHTPNMNESRGLGWEIEGSDHGSRQVFGHTGFTGTGLWLNPELDAFVILLTNRIHPHRDDAEPIRALRRELTRLAWELVQRNA
jgi:CubicO group peptidase (beta-lactamase class C family)